MNKSSIIKNKANNTHHNIGAKIRLYLLLAFHLDKQKFDNKNTPTIIIIETMTSDIPGITNLFKNNYGF